MAFTGAGKRPTATGTTRNVPMTNNRLDIIFSSALRWSATIPHGCLTRAIFSLSCRQDSIFATATKIYRVWCSELDNGMICCHGWGTDMTCDVHDPFEALPFY